MAANPQSDLVSNLRSLARQMLAVRAGFKPLREQAATPGFRPGDLTPDAFAGANSDLAAADVTALFTALDAVEVKLTDYTQQPPVPTAAVAALIKFAGNLSGS
jgi:hypothetical protein